MSRKTIGAYPAILDYISRINTKQNISREMIKMIYFILKG